MTTSVTILPYRGKLPVIGENVYLAEGTRLIGDVSIGRGSSLWFNVACRGDVNTIVIGEFSNVQDNSVVHISRGRNPTVIGNYVTIGHNAILHSCKIGDGSLIGMGAIILDDVDIGAESFVAAGSLVSPGKIFPPRSFIIGSPAVVKKEMTTKETQDLRQHADNYYKLGQEYLAERNRR